MDGPDRLLVVAMCSRRGRARSFPGKGADPWARLSTRSDAGVQGRSFIIWAKNCCQRTQITFLLGKAGDRSIPHRRCSWARFLGPSGNAPKARPKAASTPAWGAPSRIDSRGKLPSTSGTSSAPMNRVAAIQKSSRTSTRHCTRPPSHCRSASTSSPSGVSLRACSHCSNWSNTIKSFLPAGKRWTPLHVASAPRPHGLGQAGAASWLPLINALPSGPPWPPRRRSARDRPIVARGQP